MPVHNLRACGAGRGGRRRRADLREFPFSTIEVFVPTTDIRGGTGANFVVDRAATGEIAEPVY
jgi:hypothetical protein